MADFPVMDADKDITRQVLADHPDLMVVAFRFNADGAAGAVHSHVHVQSTYVDSGEFLFTIDGVETKMGAGDSLIVPSNAVHGCTCLKAGTLIDSFTPRRDDFL